MLNLQEAKQILHGQKLGSRDQLCIVLAINPVEPLPVQKIKERCIAAALPKSAKKNISDILGTSAGYVARATFGWELQQPGVLRVREIAQQANITLVVTHSSRSLRGHAESVADPLTKSFVMEAIACFEAHQYKAAVVFSCAGAG